MKPVHFPRILIVLFYSVLFYYSYRYYNDVELVEISVGEEYKLDRIRGTALSNLNYIIYYQGKVYDREYKALGLSNLLWSDDDFYDNKRHPKDPIYFYRLKSEKDLKKTSRYFLPSAKKPITNKIILALDIWGYFMTNWFWRIFFFILAIAGIMQYFKINEGVERNVFLRINTLSFFFLVFCLAFY